MRQSGRKLPDKPVGTDGQADARACTPAEVLGLNQQVVRQHLSYLELFLIVIGQTARQQLDK